MNLRSWALRLASLPWLAACATDEPTPIAEPQPPGAEGSERGAAGMPGATEAAPSSNTAELKFVSGPGVEQQDACTCTRRPEALPNQFCPWGTGASANASIGSAGGEVVVSGTASTIGVRAGAKISAGALAKQVQVALTELTTPPPKGFVDYSPVYKLEPLTLQLATPGQLTLPEQNIGGVILNDRFLYHASSLDGPYERVADSSSNAGFHQAPLTGGGYYFVGYPASQAVCPDEPARSPVAITTCPCTRRGARAAEQRCAPGTGASGRETMTPGPLGGAVRVSGTPNTRGVDARATIPGGALAKPTTVALTELQAEPPAGFVDYSPVYSVEPLNMVLGTPGQIFIPGANTADTYPDALAIYYTPSANEPFKRLPDSYTNAGFWHASLLRGGYYFVGYPASLLPPGICQ